MELCEGFFVLELELLVVVLYFPKLYKILIIISFLLQLIKTFYKTTVSRLFSIFNMNNIITFNIKNNYMLLHI